jgi:hypothetical protein
VNISDRRTPLTVGLMAVIATVLLAVAGLSACANAQAGSQEEEASFDWEAVGQAIGKEGEQMNGGVYRVNMPRSDLSVTSQGVD